MNELVAVIHITPTAKARAKAMTVKGHSFKYTPKKTRDAEKEIRFAIREKVVADGPFTAGIPLSLFAVFYLVKPKSQSKKITLPVKRPDLDNYLKLLLDALNQYAIPDDSQIVDIDAHKKYDSTARIELRVWKTEA